MPANIEKRRNKTKENLNGYEFLTKAHSESYEDILNDFENLKSSFEMEYYRFIDDIFVSEFFEKSRFISPFKELKNSHASNMLMFLGSVFKYDNDEKMHFLLGKYLCEYLMPSLRMLAKNLQISAKSNYYKAIGWFLEDYCNVIKISLGLKE